MSPVVLDKVDPLQHLLGIGPWTSLLGVQVETLSTWCGIGRTSLFGER